MKEFFASLWLGVGSLFGFTEEEPVEFTERTASVQMSVPEVVAEAPEPVIEEPEPEEQLVAPEEPETPPEAPESAEGEDGMVSDGQFDYETPEGADWWAPVQGHATISEVVTDGEEGQVSTLWGNGTQGQGEHTMDNPRDLQVDSEGNIYFIDGSQHDAKLRMFDGQKNTTIVDLVDNKVSRRDGYFATAGMAIIQDTVYVSSTEDLYRVEDGRIHQVTQKVRAYMENQRLQNLYRTETHGDYIYMMFFGKSRQFHIARYNPLTNEDIETMIPTKPMPSPYNFYVSSEGIFIATTTGYVILERFFPRETIKVWEDGDHKTEIADVWLGEDNAIYFMQWEDQASHVLYRNPKGVDAGGVTPVIGARRGFVDGFYDEVEMDYPIDFVWDGSGYVFGDMGNHALRKYWTDVAPAHVQ